MPCVRHSEYLRALVFDELVIVAQNDDLNSAGKRSKWPLPCLAARLQPTSIFEYSNDLLDRGDSDTLGKAEDLRSPLKELLMKPVCYGIVTEKVLDGAL